MTKHALLFLCAIMTMMASTFAAEGDLLLTRKTATGGTQTYTIGAGSSGQLLKFSGGVPSWDTVGLPELGLIWEPGIPGDGPYMPPHRWPITASGIALVGPSDGGWIIKSLSNNVDGSNVSQWPTLWLPSSATDQTVATAEGLANLYTTAELAWQGQFTSTLNNANTVSLIALKAGTATAGQTLTWNGSQWTPATPTVTIADGSVTGPKLAPTLTLAGAASTPALRFTTTIFSGGTGTTTLPAYYFSQPAAAQPTSFSTAGTFMAFNGGAAWTGRFLDFFAGTSRCGFISASGGGRIDIAGDGLNVTDAAGTITGNFSQYQLKLGATHMMWGASFAAAQDVYLKRLAAGVLHLSANGNTTVANTGSGAALNMPPMTAPGNPPTGWTIYTNVSTGALEAKNAAGVVSTLALP